MRPFTLESKPFLPLTRPSAGVVAGLPLNLLPNQPCSKPQDHLRLWIIIGWALPYAIDTAVAIGVKSLA